MEGGKGQSLENGLKGLSLILEIKQQNIDDIPVAMQPYRNPEITQIEPEMTQIEQEITQIEQKITQIGQEITQIEQEIIQIRQEITQIE